MSAADFNPLSALHWQDFQRPATLSLGDAGRLYRASSGLSGVLRILSNDDLIHDTDGARHPDCLSPAVRGQLMSAAAALCETISHMACDLHEADLEHADAPPASQPAPTASR